MADLIIEHLDYEPASIFDMGDGSIVFEQHNEVTGRLESIAMDYGQLCQAVEAPISSGTRRTLSLCLIDFKKAAKRGVL